VQTFYAYDAGTHLLAITHTHAGETLAHFAYAYDATGNRTRAVETVVATEEWDLLAAAVPGEPAPSGSVR